MCQGEFMKGKMDIHQINTDKTICTFQMFQGEYKRCQLYQINLKSPNLVKYINFKQASLCKGLLANHALILGGNRGKKGVKEGRLIA